MADSGQRETIIRELLNQMLASRGQDPEQAFESLRYFFRDDDIAIVFDTLIKSERARGIYWLVRYLVSVERAAGFDLLLSLATHENDYVREEARNGISKINEEARADLLLRLLEGDREDDICFALEELGKIRLEKAIIPIETVLEKYRDVRRIVVHAVNALGTIVDSKSFIILERYVHAADKEVREEALLAMGKLLKTFPPRYVKRFFQSPNTQVRSMTYRVAGRSRKSNDERYLVWGLAHEESEDIRLGILSAIRNIKTEALLDEVIDRALHDSSGNVRMVAHSLLRKVKTPLTRSRIIKRERTATGLKRLLLLRILGQYAADEEIVNVLVRAYRNSPDDRIKLTALESLGQMHDESVVHFLFDVVKERSEFSYAAALSLSRIIGPHHWPIIMDILQLDQSTMGLIIQVFLRFIQRFPDTHSLPEEVEGHLDRLASSNNPDIRYMAVRCFTNIQSSDLLNRMLNGLMYDSSVSVRSAFEKTIIEYLGKEPLRCMEILSLFAQNQLPARRFYTFIKSLKLPMDFYPEIVSKVVQLVEAQGQLPFQTNKRYALRLMVFLRILAEREKTVFLSYLERNTNRDSERQILMRVLNATSISTLPGLEVGFMASQYSGAGENVRLEYLKFFEHMVARNSEIEEAVFADMHSEASAELDAMIFRVVSSWLMRGRTPEVRIA